MPFPEIDFEHVCDLGAVGNRAILQDHHGFMWFGSEGGGLFRWDGYELKHFGVGPDQLAGSSIHWMIADPLNPDILWLATDAGLEQYHIRTGSFATVSYQPTNADTPVSYIVYVMLTDPQNPHQLWLGTDQSGLLGFDTRSWKFTPYLSSLQTTEITGIRQVTQIWEIVQDPRDPDILWLGLWPGGLARFDKQSGELIRHPHDPEDPKSFGGIDNIVQSLVQDRDDPDILWVGTSDQGLDRFDKRTGEFTHYRHDPADRFSIKPGAPGELVDDGKGRLWIGSYVEEYGLGVLDKQSGRFFTYRRNPDIQGSLSSDFVITVYTDRQGRIWYTSYDGKVGKIDPYRLKVRHYQSNPNQPDSLVSNAVTVLYQDRDGHIWMGTHGGLSCLDPNTDQFIRRWTHDPHDRLSLDRDYILGVFQDMDGDLLVSTWFGALHHLDKASGRVIHRYTRDSVTQITQDPRSPDILWMGSGVRSGLIRFEKSKRKFTFFPVMPDAPEKGPNIHYISCLLHDQNPDILWMGAWYGGGLNRLDKRSGRFTHFVPDPEDANAISVGAIAHIMQDSRGRLWIGTMGGGLERFHPDREDFTHYAAGHGIPDQVFCILEGEKGYLNLTPAEIRVACLIREGKTTKEIAKLLLISESVVRFHRENIRKKMHLIHKKVALKSYLQSMK